METPQILLTLHLLPSYCSPWGVATDTDSYGSRDSEYSITSRINRFE